MPTDTTNKHWFGRSVALSADGHVLAVGSPETRSLTGEPSNSLSDVGSPSSGGAYVFERDPDVNPANWRRTEYLRAPNGGAEHRFGVSVALSANGLKLAVAAGGEGGTARGIAGDATQQHPDFTGNFVQAGAGAVYLFSKDALTWSQPIYIKSSNTAPAQNFSRPALSGDGLTLAVGAPGERSRAMAIGGDQADTSGSGVGAVYLY